MKTVYYNPNRYDQVPKPCTELIYPYQRFLSSNIIIPMTWQQKGYLAVHNLTDPSNSEPSSASPPSPSQSIPTPPMVPA